MTKIRMKPFFIWPWVIKKFPSKSDERQLREDGVTKQDEHYRQYFEFHLRPQIGFAFEKLPNQDYWEFAITILFLQIFVQSR